MPKRSQPSVVTTHQKSGAIAVRDDSPPYRVSISANETKLRFIDLFCGIGGFRIGFERAGAHCVFSSDWDRFSRQTYAANFGETPHGDIHSVAVADIPKFDILCGGFPCQPFSLAGVSKKNSLGSDGKALIFTSYQESIDLIVAAIGGRFAIPTDFIDGRVPVPQRQMKVDLFTAEKSFAVLVLNPRAAGTGLNITAANHVIHFNPEWNPAVEDQASARAYRRGQTRAVTVHQLFYVMVSEELVQSWPMGSGTLSRPLDSKTRSAAGALALPVPTWTSLVCPSENVILACGLYTVLRCATIASAVGCEEMTVAEKEALVTKNMSTFMGRSSKTRTWIN